MKKMRQWFEKSYFYAQRTNLDIAKFFALGMMSKLFGVVSKIGSIFLLRESIALLADENRRSYEVVNTDLAYYVSLFFAGQALDHLGSIINQRGISRISKKVSRETLKRIMNLPFSYQEKDTATQKLILTLEVAHNSTKDYLSSVLDLSIKLCELTLYSIVISLEIGGPYQNYLLISGIMLPLVYLPIVRYLNKFSELGEIRRLGAQQDMLDQVIDTFSNYITVHSLDQVDHQIEEYKRTQEPYENNVNTILGFQKIIEVIQDLILCAGLGMVTWLSANSVLDPSTDFDVNDFSLMNFYFLLYVVPFRDLSRLMSDYSKGSAGVTKLCELFQLTDIFSSSAIKLQSVPTAKQKKEVDLEVKSSIDLKLGLIDTKAIDAEIDNEFESLKFRDVSYGYGKECDFEFLAYQRNLSATDREIDDIFALPNKIYMIFSFTNRTITMHAIIREEQKMTKKIITQENIRIMPPTTYREQEINHHLKNKKFTKEAKQKGIDSDLLLQGFIKLVDEKILAPDLTRISTVDLKLKNVSFTIKKGETIAVIGESGVGKSTIAKLMMGLYKPTSGIIYFNGQPLDEVEPKKLRQLITMIPQSADIFKGDIFYNVSYGAHNLLNYNLLLVSSGFQNIPTLLQENKNSIVLQRNRKNLIAFWLDEKKIINKPLSLEREYLEKLPKFPDGSTVPFRINTTDNPVLIKKVIELCEILPEYKFNLKIEKYSQDEFLKKISLESKEEKDHEFLLFQNTDNKKWFFYGQYWSGKKIKNYIDVVPEFKFLTEVLQNQSELPLDRMDFKKIRQALAKDLGFSQIEVLRVMDECKLLPLAPQLFPGLERAGRLQISGGQRQRIGIARSVLRHPALYLLDEITSALDGRNEAEIVAMFNRLNKENRNAALLVISHRLSTIKDANRILLLENETIKEVKFESKEVESFISKISFGSSLGISSPIPSF